MLRRQGFNFNFQTLVGYSTFFPSNFWWKCMVSRVRGFELRVHGCNLRRYGLPGSESTGT